VVDSLSAIGRTVEPAELRDFIVGLTSYLKARTTAGLITEINEHHSDGSPRESFAASLADATLMLRFHERDNVIRRSLTVFKIRGSGHDAAVREYVITADGLRFSEG
jgi:circadian clock protein KaiC